MATPRRVQLTPAWLLHSRDFRDSSRIIEFFTREHGRVSLFARGVRGSKSRQAALLQPFVPLLISWSGSGDGGNLSVAEPDGPPRTVAASCFMSAFYINELMLKLLGREDPHPELYDVYAEAVNALLRVETEARGLRLFEKRLMDAIGFGVDYTRVAASGVPVEAEQYYVVQPGRGVIAVASRAGVEGVYLGAHLLSLSHEQLTDDASLAAAKRLLRAAVGEALEGRPLATRRVARAVRDVGQEAEETRS